MSPYEQAKELRRTILPILSARKEDLKRVSQDGPKTTEDYKLLVAVLNFALAEVCCFEGENQTGIVN